MLGLALNMRQIRSKQKCSLALILEENFKSSKNRIKSHRNCDGKFSGVCPVSRDNPVYST